MNNKLLDFDVVDFLEDRETLSAYVSELFNEGRTEEVLELLRKIPATQSVIMQEKDTLRAFWQGIHSLGLRLALPRAP